eukprot:CAMPEP_0184519946 /NCGR_PEP_ID=MMETSP0198_2-20121128/6900_1 /TAXON_ID=1112570 /ORGANISM="Thraustochytrium sp., Strain LLF1b" /LENGTH=100 /DNA_ID=CAMNT_0026910501 /DNA_START=259 /DNA_END=561 /DNA_ORIENTATION=-
MAPGLPTRDNFRMPAQLFDKRNVERRGWVISTNNLRFKAAIVFRETVVAFVNVGNTGFVGSFPFLQRFANCRDHAMANSTKEAMWRPNRKDKALLALELG